MDHTVLYDEVVSIADGKHPEIYFIDVREIKEIQETGLIPKSINIPLATVNGELTKLDAKAFGAKYGREPPNQDSPIVFTCRSGKRAQQALHELHKVGFTNLSYYPGSWLEWESKHKPTQV